jgi:hypothetical protein
MQETKTLQGLNVNSPACNAGTNRKVSSDPTGVELKFVHCRAFSSTLLGSLDFLDDSPRFTWGYSRLTLAGSWCTCVT